MVKTQAVDSNDESDFERAVCAAVDEVESTTCQHDFAPGCVPRSPPSVQSHIDSTPEKETHHRHGHRQTPPQCARRLFHRDKKRCNDVQPLLARDAAATAHTEIDSGVAMPRKRKRNNVVASRSSCCNDVLCDERVAEPHAVSPRKRKRKNTVVSRSRRCKRIGSIHPVWVIFVIPISLRPWHTCDIPPYFTDTTIITMTHPDTSMPKSCASDTPVIYLHTSLIHQYQNHDNNATTWHITCEKRMKTKAQVNVERAITTS